MEGRVGWQPDDHDRFVRQVERWRVADATHLDVNTMDTGLATVDDHIAALTTVATLLDVLP